MYQFGVLARCSCLGGAFDHITSFPGIILKMKRATTTESSTYVRRVSQTVVV